MENRIVMAVLWLSIVSGVSGEMSAQAQSPCPDPPDYQVLRQDEDYSYLQDPACRVHRWDSLKFVPQGSRSDSYLTIGGEAREWYEAFRNYNWGLSPPKYNAYLLQRLTAYSDFHVNGRVRFFIQPMSAIEAGRKGGPRPVIDESKLFFEQAFVDITVAPEKENSLVMRLGRQEFTSAQAGLWTQEKDRMFVWHGMESLSFGKRPHGTCVLSPPSLCRMESISSTRRPHPARPSGEFTLSGHCP